MTDDTRNCDEVAGYLESRYPELANAVLVIHTKNNGEISEASSGKSKEELDRLRKLSRTIDDPDNPVQGNRFSDGAARGLGRAERRGDRRTAPVHVV